MKLKDKLKAYIIPYYKVYLYYRNKLFCKINPQIVANYVYKRVFGHNINWENPQDLIEKISWMELYTDTSLWTKCADKYRVREYIKEKGCEETLVKLYGAWENPEEIDFDSLPNRFVLKANNGCGTVMIVKDKNKLNRKKTIKTLKSWLKRPFGYSSAQLHYLDIKRCIIAEELLSKEAGHDLFSPHSLVDYKVWCINGKPESILVTYDRTKNSLKMDLYTTNWERMQNEIIGGKHYIRNTGDILPKPGCLTKMLEYAIKLSKEFPQVRVDFYIANDKIYFGELTLSSGYGYFTPEYYKYLGSKIDLSKLKKQPQRRV